MNTESLRREDQLLLLVATPNRERAADCAIKLLDRDFDWDYLLKMAERHGLLPLLARHLDSHEVAIAPAWVHEKLRSTNHHITRSNLALTSELLKTLDLFEARGIPAVPFKGPTLATLAYGDISSREFLDLDILVRKEDVLAVRDLLIERGFCIEPQITKAQQAAWLRFDCAGTFVNERGILLDIHWDFAPKYFSVETPLDDLRSRLQSITIGDREVPALSPEDLLYVLCLHSFTHAWERLGWIADVVALIDRCRLDWPAIKERAVKSGSIGIISLGLLLAHDILGTELPEEFSRSIHVNSRLRRLAEEIRANLFAERRLSFNVFADAARQIGIRERTRDRIKTALRLVATPRRYDWEFVTTPEALVGLQYPLRPVRMARDYLAALRNQQRSISPENTSAHLETS